MGKYPVKISSIQHITHDVLKIVVEKPLHYDFIPSLATEVTINKDGWKDKKRPFTFTALPVNEFLQFTIKTYPSHKGFTNELLQLKKNDELILHEVFGVISYKGEGVFIAGGFLKANISNFNQQFYLCGPPPMMEAVQKQLSNLGISK